MCKREIPLYRTSVVYGMTNAELGDKTFMELDGLGEFAATVHKVTDEKVMLIFDD